MPTIQNQSMTLQPNGTGVRVTVTYTATFSPVEQFLMANGLLVEERIHLVGDDEAAAGGPPVYTSPAETVAPAPRSNQLVRTRHLDLPRASLQEDPSEPIYKYYSWGPGQPPVKIQVGSTPNDDELLARVELSYAGLTTQTQADTAVKVLAG